MVWLIMAFFPEGHSKFLVWCLVLLPAESGRNLIFNILFHAYSEIKCSLTNCNVVSHPKWVGTEVSCNSYRTEHCNDKSWLNDLLQIILAMGLASLSVMHCSGTDPNFCMCIVSIHWNVYSPKFQPMGCLQSVHFDYTLSEVGDWSPKSLGILFSDWTTTSLNPCLH